jgi:hypothetical protein
VDEEKALAYGVPAESAQLRAATVGSDEGCWWMWDDPEPPWGP